MAFGSPRAAIGAVLHEHTHDFVFALEKRHRRWAPAHDRSDGSDPPRAQRGRARARHSSTYAASINSVLPIFLMSKRVRTTEYNKTKRRGYVRGIRDVPCSFVRFGESPAPMAASIN